jgi:hypothetical protein
MAKKMENPSESNPSESTVRKVERISRLLMFAVIIEVIILIFIL